jgi:hypothetical protein
MDARTLLHRCLQTLCDPCRMPAADPGLDGPGGPAAIVAWKKSDGPAGQCRDGRKFQRGTADRS